MFAPKRIVGGVRLATGYTAISAAYVFFAAFALLSDLVWLKVAGLAAAVVFSFIGWLSSARRYHLIADTPTSRIASAAQGFIELVGRCDTPPGVPPLGFRSSPPCVWYRYTISRDRDGATEVVDQGASEDTFLLRDDSGECVIDPHGAEIHTTHHRSSRENGYEVDLEYLLPGETLYVLGSFRTESAASAVMSKRADVSAKLAEWKSDSGQLLERFDRNRDGEISPGEWDVARAAAEEDVDAHHREMRRRTDIHVVDAGAGDRPYLISNRDPARVARRFRLWSWFHLAAFLAASVAGAVMLGRHLL